MRRFVKNDIENSKNLLDNLKKIIELRLQNIMNAENLRGLSMEHGVVLNIKKWGGTESSHCERGLFSRSLRPYISPYLLEP